MKVLHTYCLNYNIGDYALGIGVKNLLRKSMPIELIGNTNLQGRVFNEYYINEVVNKRYDFLIIGGGGIIHGKHWPNGWFWLIEKDLIKQIKIPFAIYSAGVNYWDEEGGIPQKAIEHLTETMKYASHFSVRNDGSAELFYKQVGIMPQIVPDPGFHIGLQGDFHNNEKVPYVIVQLANDKPLNRFGNSHNKESFVENMRVIVKNISKTYNVILTPHVLEDVELSIQVAKGIKNTRIWDFSYYAFDHIPEAMNLYKYADYVLAMRGHGQIIPIGFNTPVIALNNHPKHFGLMRDLGLEKYVVSISDTNFVEKTIDLIKGVEENKNSLDYTLKALNIKLLNQSYKAINDIANKILK